MAVVIVAASTACAALTNLDDLRGDAATDAAAQDEPATYVPAAGYYSYAPTPDSGDLINFVANPDASITVPFSPHMPCLVTVDAGMWSWALVEAKNHATAYTFSTAPSELLCVGTVETIVGNVATITCNPAAQFISEAVVDGGPLSQSCLGSNSLVDGSFGSSGPYSFVGNDVVNLPDGATIPSALHFEMQRTVTGNTQSGSQTVQWWLDTTTGLPLRVAVQTHVNSPSPFGATVFTESADFTIESTTPSASLPDGSSD